MHPKKSYSVTAYHETYIKMLTNLPKLSRLLTAARVYQVYWCCQLKWPIPGCPSLDSPKVVCIVPCVPWQWMEPHPPCPPRKKNGWWSWFMMVMSHDSSRSFSGVKILYQPVDLNRSCTNLRPEIHVTCDVFWNDLIFIKGSHSRLNHQQMDDACSMRACFTLVLLPVGGYWWWPLLIMSHVHGYDKTSVMLYSVAMYGEEFQSTGNDTSHN